MKQPEIELVDGGVRVTVWRRIVGSGVGSMSPAQLTDRQLKILNMIKKNSQVSATEMSVVLSVVKRTIERELARMQEMGVITHEGNTSAGKWVVLKELPNF
ncbi:MAG: HTH domain-containing protein [Paludibacteraceae bacterium]|nr:HTH domain-containing protein [Paludibacteraceae bacterium]